MKVFAHHIFFCIFFHTIPHPSLISGSMPRYFSGFIELGSRTTEAGPKNSRELWWWFITSSELWWITQVQLQVQKKYHRSYYYHSTIVEFIVWKEIPGTPNSRTPTPIVLPYHSYKNPLKYGNGLEACGILLCIESWIEHPRPKIIHAWSFVPWKLPGSFLLVLGIFTTFLRKLTWVVIPLLKQFMWLYTVQLWSEVISKSCIWWSTTWMVSWQDFSMYRVSRYAKKGSDLCQLSDSKLNQLNQMLNQLNLTTIR